MASRRCLLSEVMRSPRGINSYLKLMSEKSGGLICHLKYKPDVNCLGFFFLNKKYKPNLHVAVLYRF